MTALKRNTSFRWLFHTHRSDVLRNLLGCVVASSFGDVVDENALYCVLHGMSSLIAAVSNVVGASERFLLPEISSVFPVNIVHMMGCFRLPKLFMVGKNSTLTSLRKKRMSYHKANPTEVKSPLGPRVGEK